jgi:hypothetical protein
MCRAISRYICLMAMIFSVGAYLRTHAWADELNFTTDHQYTNSTGTTKFKLTGEKLDTDYQQLNQLYNLNLSKNLWPYLLLNAGTVYQINSTWSKTGDNKVDTKEKILSPFAELNLTNPIYQAGIALRKRRIEENVTDLQNTQADRDEITGTVGMNPPSELFPDWNLRYSHIHTYDDPKTTDQTQKVWLLDTAYNPLKNLLLNYSYARTDTDEDFLNFDTTEQSHLGKAEYFRSFLNERLFMDTSYTINYNKFEFSGTGASAEVPLLRFSGLSSLDNTPQDGPALGANPALIDGNVITSAGLDIGTAGDQAQRVNIGLDFGFAIDVDTLYVWVDRRLSNTVINSFSWQIYTSPDNTDLSTWTLVPGVLTVNFDTFDNRFEISFPRVNTRFIKAVTAALSPVVPDAGNFPNIFITELQAFITASGASINSQTSVLNQNYNLGLRGKLSDRTLVGYNLFYNQQDNDPGNVKRTQYTNGLYLNHTFNETFSANANGQRTDTSTEVSGTTTEDIYNYTYGTSLRANWLETFNQSLTFSGSYDNTELGSSSQNALFLRNNAILYRGWSAFLDTGYTWENPEIGSQITSFIFRQGTNLQPNQKISLNLNFSYKRNMQSGGDFESSDETRWDIQAFYVPLRNLSFFARINTVKQQNSTDTFQNYTVNWSPFPDGDLQFSFVFNEILLSENNEEQRVVGPSLKWTIGPHIFLDMSYNFTMNDSDTEKIESNVFSADIRTNF